MLLASIPRGTGDHRCHATPIFKWGSLVRLISWPAHINVAQQGRLQTRSLFTRLPSPLQPAPENHYATFNRSTTTISPLTRRGSPCKQCVELGPPLAVCGAAICAADC
jgi:hypothetical protein